MSPDDDRTSSELLARARSGMTPGAADKGRMRARLMASVGAVGAVSASATAAAAAGGGAHAAVAGASAWGTKLAVLALAASMLGGVAALVIATSPAPNEADPHEAPTVGPAPEATPPSPSTEAAPALAAPPEPVVPAPLEIEAVPTVPVAAEPRPRARRDPEETAAAPVAPSSDTLAEETALIGRARRALRGDDARGALAALDEHARRYPGSALAEERDVQRVRAYCALGDVARADAEAHRFVREHPGSLSAEAMTDPCAR